MGCFTRSTAPSPVGCHAPTAKERLVVDDKLATRDPSLAPLDETLYAADGTDVAANGCYGDSGGPLLLSEDGQPVVAGVASFVDSAVCDALTVYARSMSSRTSSTRSST